MSEEGGDGGQRRGGGRQRPSLGDQQRRPSQCRRHRKMRRALASREVLHRARLDDVVYWEGGLEPIEPCCRYIPETGRGAHRAKMNGILGGRSRRHPCRTPPICMYDGYLFMGANVGCWDMVREVVRSLGLAHAVAFSGDHLRAGAHRGNDNCGVFLVFQRGVVGRLCDRPNKWQTERVNDRMKHAIPISRRYKDDDVQALMNQGTAE